jgi:tetratricopeptide (TPR) repeat protein
MDKYSIYKFALIMGLGLQLVAGCSEPVPGDKDSQPVIEAGLLRKNGKLLIESGRSQEAIAAYDKLIALEPQNALAYNGKAIAFDHSGNHLAAQDLYKQALSIDPGSLTIKNNLAMSLILNNQPQQAIALLDPLVKTGGGSTPSAKIMRHNLAMAYGISGQYGKATKLNLMDMSTKQAKENISFYKSYSKKHAGAKNVKGKNNKDNNNMNIGFISPDKPETKPPSASAQETVNSGSGFSFLDKSAVYDYPN